MQSIDRKCWALVRHYHPHASAHELRELAITLARTVEPDHIELLWRAITAHLRVVPPQAQAAQ